MHIYKLKGCPHCLSTERLESSQTQSGMLTVIEWDIRSPEWRDGAQWEGGYSAFVTTDDRVKFESHHFPTHTHTHSSSHYRTPRSRNGTAPDRIENLALVRPPGQLDVMLVYAARYVPKKQRRWWNAVRVIFSCTTSLSLSPSLSRFTLTLHFEYVGCRSWRKRDFHFLSSGWSSTARKVFLVLVRVYLL